MAAFSLGKKWGIVGGGVGLAVGITVALAKKKNHERLDADEPESDTPYLDAHETLAHACLELAQFRHVAPSEFRTVRACLDEALEIAAKAGAATRQTVRHAWPGMVRNACYRGSEALRGMAARVGGRADAEEFDALASEIQTTFDSTFHNVTLDVSCVG